MRLFFGLLLVFCCANLSISQTKHLTLEPNHSTLGFEVSIAGGATKVTGKFMESDLKLTYIDGDWAKSIIHLSINAASINTGIPDRDKHLQTVDFFEVEKYPTITFVSKTIEKIDSTHFKTNGVFTMHGISKEMSIPFEVTYEDGNTIGIHLETIVNRIIHGVGIDFKHTVIENFVSDDILVKFDFWTKRDKKRAE